MVGEFEVCYFSSLEFWGNHLFCLSISSSPVRGVMDILIQYI